MGMSNFTPWAGLIGGLMIGLASALFLLLAGRIAGISGILEGALKPNDAGWAWRIAFLSGLPLGVVITMLVAPGVVQPIVMTAKWPVIVLSGLLVGFGTRIAGGCTSGHGVCGISRLSARSIAATAIFMATAVFVVFVTRHLV
jgi:uncharacterized membrane protein YedE/YeeE